MGRLWTGPALLALLAAAAEAPMAAAQRFIEAPGSDDARGGFLAAPDPGPESVPAASGSGGEPARTPFLEDPLARLSADFAEIPPGTIHVFLVVLAILLLKLATGRTVRVGGRGASPGSDGWGEDASDGGSGGDGGG